MSAAPVPRAQGGGQELLGGVGWGFGVVRVISGSLWLLGSFASIPALCLCPGQPRGMQGEGSELPGQAQTLLGEGNLLSASPSPLSHGGIWESLFSRGISKRPGQKGLGGRFQMEPE